MPRFVVMESTTGNLYGDTARLGTPAKDIPSAADAALLIDRSRGRAKRGFGFVKKHSPNAALDVYRITEEQALAAPPAKTTGEAMALLHRHSEFETSLVSFNS